MLFALLFCWCTAYVYASEEIDNQVITFQQPHVKPLSQKNGVPYPISASWFRDRYTAKEWADALDEFQSIGGDTVWLRAPPMLVRSKQEILQDPAFIFCRSYKSPSGLALPNCITEAEEELQQFKIKGFATYQYEEDFSEKIMLCPQYDRKINSSRIYYRLVLPLQTIKSNPCDIPDGAEVLVVITSYVGIDPHYLLVESASKRNMSVYFSLPSFQGLQEEYFPPYFQLVYRILNEHMARYSTELANAKYSVTGGKLYDVIKGYYSTDEVCLCSIPPAGNQRRTGFSYSTDYKETYTSLGNIVHMFGKEFAISPYIILTKSLGNFSVDDHVKGFEALANTQTIDIIAIQEGRGIAKGVYYWPTEINKRIKDVDPVLDKIVYFLDPTVWENVTFEEQFTGSNNELLRLFRESRDRIVAQGTNFEFWLNIEAFEYLRDDICLPVDPAGSGMAGLIDRTTKQRLDKALTVAGAQPQKIITFAWDSDYTCTTKARPTSLAQDIIQDSDRPILADCRWHSPQNMSIVVIGYNLLRQTQSFEVNYPRVQGDRKTATLYGYYVEADYGLQHQRPDSLVYMQLSDVMEPWFIASFGVVTVKADSAYHACVFEY